MASVSRSIPFFNYSALFTRHEQAKILTEVGLHFCDPLSDDPFRGNYQRSLNQTTELISGRGLGCHEPCLPSYK